MSPPPPCVPVRASLNISQSTILHNNLGGVGPDDAPENIRYGGAGELDGVPFDLLVETIADYRAKNGKKNNGKYGDFGQINIGYGSRTKLRFSFVEPGTTNQVILPQISFVVYDFDTATKYGDCNEMVAFDSVDQPFGYTLHDPPTITIEQNGTQIWFESDRIGNDGDNPTSPAQLTEEQAASSVKMTFDNLGHFDMALAFAEPVVGSSPFQIDIDPCYKVAGGRNFIFEGSVPCQSLF